MNTRTQHAAKELEEMTVGCTKVINGRSVTRWSIIRWEVGTHGTGDAGNLTETLVELGFDAD